MNAFLRQVNFNSIFISEWHSPVFSIETVQLSSWLFWHDPQLFHQPDPACWTQQFELGQSSHWWCWRDSKAESMQTVSGGNQQEFSTAEKKQKKKVWGLCPPYNTCCLSCESLSHHLPNMNKWSPLHYHAWQLAWGVSIERLFSFSPNI